MKILLLAILSLEREIFNFGFVIFLRILLFMQNINNEINGIPTSLQCEGMQITLQSKADTVKIAVENTFNYCIRNMFMCVYIAMAKQIIFCVTYFIHPKHWSLLKVLKFFNLNNGPLNKFSLSCQIEISLVSHGVENATSSF
ncbi:hypothetical protein GQX74_002153 [Glossina fuscipes]|nr:hypothetical protein GQX74_002153 [Glossina fuscipes]